jgi:hypothetical protein
MFESKNTFARAPRKCTMSTGVGFMKLSCCAIQQMVILYSLLMRRANEIGAFVGNLSLMLSDELPQH